MNKGEKEEESSWKETEMSIRSPKVDPIWQVYYVQTNKSEEFTQACNHI